jgi:Ca-activated chloride channel homolog
VSFQKLHLLPYIILGSIFIVWLFRKYEKEYFSWVKKYFFFERTLQSQISGLLNLIGIILLLVSLLDLRGPEQQHKSQIPDQKTIIIIDSSASMLAEDVRPNRFQKSILLARHFVKKAVGHQIAVVLFSDTQKRLVPFTDDIDLLDSRVAGLAKNELLKGGSNISQAIMESFQYFKMDGAKKSELGGNVLVFTDSEEHENSIELEVPDGINLAVVGVGTSRGAPIPIRSDKGVFYGYKKFENENVMTKLDVEYIKKIGQNADNFKYWIATSFSIPTEEILGFFRGIHKSKMNEGLVRTRPVYSQYILYPAILCLMLANMLGNLKTFTTVMLILLFPLSLLAQEEEKEEKPLSPETIEFMLKFKEGGMSPINRLKLGELLARDKRAEKSLELYTEILKPDLYAKNLIPSVNMGTVNLMAGKVKEGIKTYHDINSMTKAPDEIKNTMRKNILLALRQQQQQQQKKNQQDKKQKDKNKQSGDGEQKKEDQDQGDKGQQDQNKQNEKKEDKEKKDKGKSEEEKKKEQESEKQKKQEQLTNEPQSLEEKEEELKKKRKMVKIPAMLKQIMDTDRQLQKKYQDTSTKDRTKSRLRKDW